MQNMKIRNLLALLAITPTCWALESDRIAKLIFEGEGCTTKMKVNQTECLKRIRIEQGTLLIKAEYGLVTHQKQGINNVLLKGHQAYMEQMMEDNDKLVIKANEIDYQKAAEIVYLSGNVSITSSIGVTTGEDLEFNLKTQEMISTSKSHQPFRMEIDQKDD